MYYLAAIVVTFIISSPAHAQTTNLQAELNALLAQLAALQAQLQGASAPTAPTTAVVGVQCPSLSRALRQGMSGADVSELQSFLASDRAVYPDGAVSGYFGALTQAAVQRFQAKHGIVNSGSPASTGFGAVGPATRSVIAALCAGGSVQVSVPSPYTCVLGGFSVPAGSQATFYSTTQAPLGSSCAAYAAVRQCHNGVFSGNAAYQFRSCEESEAASCSIDGERVAHGTAFKYYSKRRIDTVGETCAQFSQTRTCSNGVLSGSADFRYLSCSVEVRDSCTLGGVTVADGQSRTFYRYAHATSTNQCSSYGLTRTCSDGTLSGSSDYSRVSCGVGACELDGVTYAHGSSSTFYFAQNIPAHEQCSSYAQARTCTSGAFSGNAAYRYRTCASASSGTCVVDNVTFTSGQSRTFYASSTAPVGASCSSIAQTRTCTNGTVSGGTTYNRSSCVDTAACSLDGVTVTHGSSTTFYSARTVPFGSTCGSSGITRQCTNGMLSGSVAYQYGSCSVNPPTSLVPSSAQFAAALTALEALLKDALVQLDSWF